MRDCQSDWWPLDFGEFCRWWRVDFGSRVAESGDGGLVPVGDGGFQREIDRKSWANPVSHSPLL